jgi:glycosyltransferase involved in cell wall biosynthesis
MNETPLVTIITATFNKPETLKYTIESVLNQDLTDFEYWVIGDCCTDNTEIVVQSFQDNRIKWFNLPENVGSQTGPNNEGLRRAKGKYIAFLGHDDLWFPNHLSTLVDFLEQTQSDFVYASTLAFSEDGNHKVIGVQEVFGTKQLFTGAKMGFVPPSSWLFKKTVSDVCGFWQKPEGLDFPIDYTYLIKIVDNQFKLSGKDDLFILKFPSPWWGLYSRKINFPQTHYWSLIRQNPTAALTAALVQISKTNGLRVGDVPTYKQLLKAFLKRTFHLFCYYYSYDRFPVKQMMAWVVGIRRKQAIKKRGLIRLGPRSC